FTAGKRIPQAMWSWQILQDFLYRDTREVGLRYHKPVWTALEWNVPGHDHAATGILAGQFPGRGKKGNADALARFEYLFDREDKDLSEGNHQGWTGKETSPSKANRNAGIFGHQKALKAVQWMQKLYPLESYIIPNHVERRGAWKPRMGGGNGWNIEHIRDLNNSGPDVCFGWEGQPGHQGKKKRGGYRKGSSGGGTYGGTGLYSAAIGNMWDALLGEGRHWWFFANCDWHRGQETGEESRDFWPGQYQRNYVWVKDKNQYDAQDILDGMRSGNSFVVMGDLVDGLKFQATGMKQMFWGLKIMNNTPKTMGQTLFVNPGDVVVLVIEIRDPEDANHCPYSFNNPSLRQLEIERALNKPELNHVDLISGEITGPVDPGNPHYKDPKNPTTRILRRVLKEEMIDEQNGWKKFFYVYRAEKGRHRYFRLRGTNLPPGTPYETSKTGDPLPDIKSGNIPCSAQNCTNGKLDQDVEAWADLWFYSNPIFVKVRESRKK
ncbi:hypothetical protein ACFL2O_03440, partial [Thermodesulfobacteriota bacterium]